MSQKIFVDSEGKNHSGQQLSQQAKRGASHKRGLRILVPIDGSAYTEGVVRHALSLVRSGADHITVVTVQPSQSEHDDSRAMTKTSDDEHKLLALFLKWQPHQFPWDHTIRSGDARAVICSMAAEYDYVVIGARGAGGLALEGLEIGSVADYVLRNAPSSVVLARPHK